MTRLQLHHGAVFGGTWTKNPSQNRPTMHCQPRNPQISSAMSKWLINNSRISFNAHKTIAPNWGWQWSHIQPRFQIVVRAYWNKFGRCLLVTSELRKRPGISDVDNASRDCFWGRAFCLFVSPKTVPWSIVNLAITRPLAQFRNG